MNPGQLAKDEEALYMTDEIRALFEDWEAKQAGVDDLMARHFSVESGAVETPKLMLSAEALEEIDAAKTAEQYAWQAYVDAVRRLR